MDLRGDAGRLYDPFQPERHQNRRHFNSVIVVLQVVVMVAIMAMVVYGVAHGEGAGTLVSSKLHSGLRCARGTDESPVRPYCASRFLGFDGISSLSEETKDAERVIPKAIFLTALIGGVIFVVVSYFLQLYFPDISRFKDPDASQPEIMLYVAGKASPVRHSDLLLCPPFWHPVWRHMLAYPA